MQFRTRSTQGFGSATEAVAASCGLAYNPLIRLPHTHTG